MAIYYSASKNAFYDTTLIATDIIPADKVEITADEYTALLDAQNNGYLIVAGEGGKTTTLKQDCSACTKTLHELVEATADTLGHVKLDATPTEGSKNGVSSAGIKEALTKMDADVVHISKNETITGTKTFSADTFVTNENPFYALKASGATKGTVPSSNIMGGIECYDKEGTAVANKVGSFSIEYKTNGNAVSSMKAYKPVKGSTEFANVSVVYPASGDPYATAPTPPPNDNTDKIATTKWVKGITDNFDGSKYLPKTGGTMTGDVVFDKGTSAASLRMANNLVYLILRGGTSYDGGGTIALYGAGTNKQGEVDIVAHDGTNARTLNLKADGSLVWYGKNIVRSVNGTNADANGNVTINTTAGVTSFNGSTGAVKYTAPVTSVNGKTGAVTVDTGVTSFNGSKGAITYTAPVTSVNGKTGAVSFKYVTSQTNNGNTGYRKWSDGTIENWGVVSISAKGKATLTFSLAFASGFSIQVSPQSTSTNGDLETQITAASKTGVTVYSFQAGYVYVYAIGK